MVKFVTVFILFYIFFISNQNKPSNYPFKPHTQTRENRSPFLGRFEPYFLTRLFGSGDNFGPELAHTRPPLLSS
jgi:hypothetical protein